MKTRITTLLVLVGLLVSGFVNAREEANTKLEIRNAISEIISKAISNPDFLSEKNMIHSVSVDISIQKDGSIVVNASNSSDQILKVECVATLLKIKSKKLKSYAGERILLKINYKFYK